MHRSSNPASVVAPLWILGIGIICLAGMTAANSQPAGVKGSAYEPWQEGGLPSGEQASPTLAVTIDAMPKKLPRSAAPGLEESITAARAAVAACAAKGSPVSALVTDAAGEPIVLLSGNGAGVRSQLIARTKANIVVRYRAPSQSVADRAKAEPQLNADAAADPAIGMLRGGGLPIMRDGAMIGAVAVSGGSLAGGDLTLDETCAKAGLSKLMAPTQSSRP